MESKHEIQLNDNKEEYEFLSNFMLYSSSFKKFSSTIKINDIKESEQYKKFKTVWLGITKSVAAIKAGQLIQSLINR